MKIQKRKKVEYRYKGESFASLEAALLRAASQTPGAARRGNKYFFSIEITELSTGEIRWMSKGKTFLLPLDAIKNEMEDAAWKEINGGLYLHEEEVERLWELFQEVISQM